MPYTDEVDALGIFVPQEGVHVRFKLCLQNVSRRSRVHDKQAVQVGFVAVTLHALPGDVCRREGDSYHIPVFFRDVFGFLWRQGRRYKCRSWWKWHTPVRFSYGMYAMPPYRRRAPCQLLDTAPGLHRAFVWLSSRISVTLLMALPSKSATNGWGLVTHSSQCLYIRSVTMMPVAFGRSGCLSAVLFTVFTWAMKGVSAVGRKRTLRCLPLVLSQLLASAAVGIHFPYLAAAGCCKGKASFLPSLKPRGLSFLPGVMRYLGIVTTVGIHDEDFAVTLVLGRCNRIPCGQSAFRRGYGHTADASHRPECLGCHTLSFNLDVRPLDERCCVPAAVRHLCASARGQCHGC